MEQLATPVEKLSFVGPRSLARLKELGIRTVRDLLWHFPHRYHRATSGQEEGRGGIAWAYTTQSISFARSAGAN